MGKDAEPLLHELSELKEILRAEREQRAREDERHRMAVDQYEQTIDQQRGKLDQLQQTIERLLRRLCGSKQERIDPGQLMLFDVQELAAIVDEATAPQPPCEDDSQTAPDGQNKENKEKSPGHGRRRLPDHLPRETIRHELSQEQLPCPCCGEDRHAIGQETSEQLEYVPASFKVIEHVRITYACPSCQEHVATAPKPAQPIEKGLPGPGLMASLIVGKFGDHLPLYRHEDIFTRHGLIIRRSTLCGWLAAAADLLDPLYQLMIQQVLQSDVIHTDDTTVKLLNLTEGQAATARFWAYVGDAAHPYSIYDFTISRGRAGPAEFLKHYQGYLQADAYGGYDGIYLDSKGAIIEVGCWAHTRRYWWEARTTDSRRAHEALSYIAQLYQLESKAVDLDAESRRQMRHSHALPILGTFRQWIDAQALQVLPKSPIAQACRYTLNQWDALARYCENGNLAIDNNISERTVKIPAIGRKNWLFVASEQGGRRAAILLSFIASCKANQVEPFAYLRDILTLLPSCSTSELPNLLPDIWRQSHPEHLWMIDALRRQERERDKQAKQAKQARRPH